MVFVTFRKETLAEDKADLRDFKERFLQGMHDCISSFCFLCKVLRIVLLCAVEGDLYEDGLQMRNGFFRTRRFARIGSEQGSVDLFAEERGMESGGEGEEEEVTSQAEARRRKDRLEREEFMRKCRVSV